MKRLILILLCLLPFSGLSATTSNVFGATSLGNALLIPFSQLPSGIGAQTPWISDIDGSTFNFSGAGTFSIGNGISIGGGSIFLNADGSMTAVGKAFFNGAGGVLVGAGIDTTGITNRGVEYIIGNQTNTGTLNVTGHQTNYTGFSSMTNSAVASTAITFPGTTAKWTNTFGVNIVLYIDNTGVTGTTVLKNNQQIFSALVGDVVLLLKPGDYFAETYSVGTPTGRWEPQ